MRITIDDDIIDKIIDECEKQIVDHIKSAIEKAEKHNKQPTKQKAMKQVNDLRIKRTKEKITNAINLLRLENAKINAYQISKKSGLSYNTVRKYFIKKD